jgi:hypothetical protein
MKLPRGQASLKFEFACKEYFQKRDGSAHSFFSPFQPVMQRVRQDEQNEMIVKLIQRGKN